MKRLLFSLLACGCLLNCVAIACAESPVDVGNKAQLFVDSYLVRDSQKVSFTLHQARKVQAEPVLVPDQPWETWSVSLYGSVLFDREEQLFKMWYQVQASDYFDVNVACYATSADGIHWKKPLVGTLKAKNGKPHNAVMRCEINSVIKDVADKDPKRRYKMIAFIPDEGYHTLVSPDGLNWSRHSRETIAPIAHPEDVICAFWDAPRRQYVAFAKMQLPVRGRLRRCMWCFTSYDFEHWSKPELAFAPDLRDDAGTLARLEEVRPMLTLPDRPKVMRTEFYQVSGYAAESCLIALPMVFSINANVRGNQEGISVVQLAASRDLVHWERPFRTPCLARGAIGSWDSGFFTTASDAIRVGDEIRLYFGGTNYSHGNACLYDPNASDESRCRGSIGLAAWQLDRFVSADGPAEGGTLTTVPVRFAGKRLELNARTTAGGKLQVELLDAAGQPIEGVARSEAFSGDNLRHVVTFAGKQDVSMLAGTPVTLRFHLRNAELFSFAFRE